MMENDQKVDRNTGAAFGGRPIGSVFLSTFWSVYTIDIYGYSLYIPYIFHIYFLDMFHIFSFVCFLIYGVKSRSGYDRSQTFGQISHVSGPKTKFLTKFLNDSAWFCVEKLKKLFFDIKKNLRIRPKTWKYDQTSKKKIRFKTNICLQEMPPRFPC